MKLDKKAEDYDQSWARDNTAATTLPCFQVNNCFLFLLYNEYIRSDGIHCDTESLTFVELFCH